MKLLWGFIFSDRREIYKEIAKDLETTTWKVYKLAHGCKTKTHKDCQILDELKTRRIVSHIYPW